jgi:putative Mg2+ transporter-C (MgtC) family protein
LEDALTMPLHVGWGEIALRLGLSLGAGAVIGINRSEQVRPAGLRTTILVCLAAAIAMIEANLLLPTAGKPPTSFITMDLMRLPLGILTGMGFIGAGAIIRRGAVVEGVTTAATMWFVTVMGLCFGGGQLGLGVAALGLAALVLWCLKWVERQIGIPRRGTLTIAFDANSAIETDATKALARTGCQVAALSRSYGSGEDGCEIRYDVRWRDHGRNRPGPDIVGVLAGHPGVRRLEWQQQAPD